LYTNLVIEQYITCQLITTTEVTMCVKKLTFLGLSFAILPPFWCQLHMQLPKK